jgi:ribosomal protein S18 acetylase RimI-like enzyme
MIVRNGRATDSAAIADLHIEAFPGYFLTHLGAEFLQRYYAPFLEGSHTSVVAESEGKVIGFVVGTSNVDQLNRSIFRPNFLAFARIVVTKTFTDSVVRRGIFARVAHVPVAVKSLFSRNAHVEPHSSATSYLYSIAVTPARHGSSTAHEMLTYYVRQERRRGLDMVELTVFETNGRALRFYEREGFVRHQSSGSSVRLSLHITADEEE